MRALLFALLILPFQTAHARYNSSDCQQRDDGCDYYLQYTDDPQHLRYRSVPGAATVTCPDIQRLIASVYWETDYRLRLVITDRDNERFEVPAELRPASPENVADNLPNQLYSWEIKDDENGWGFVVKRSETNVKIFDSQSLQFCDQFIQLSTDLTDDHHLYGLGVRAGPLRVHPNTYTMWNVDPNLINQPSENQTVLGYGSHPAYWSIESDSSHVHSVVMYNANAMDIVVTDRHIIYQTTGGVIDLTFLFGPDPTALSRQYAELVGMPTMMPAWALGFQASMWGLHDVDATKQVVDQHLSNHFPLDAIWNDRDHLSYYFDWALDPARYGSVQMKQLRAYLADHSIKHMFTASSGIPALINHSSSDPNSTYFAYQAGIAANIFIATPDNASVLYSCGDASVPLAYADFSNPATLSWWRAVLSDWVDDVGALHGVLLTNNEIATLISGELQENQTCLTVNQSEGPIWSNISLVQFTPGVAPTAHSHMSKPMPDDMFPPPYLPGSLDLNDHSLNISARMITAHFYNMHNLYSLMQQHATRLAFESMNRARHERSFVMSRSSFLGSGGAGGVFTGTHDGSFESLRNQLPQLLQLSLHAVAFTGSDLCGAGLLPVGSEAESCARWLQFGALMSFMRLHYDGVNAVQQDRQVYSWPEPARSVIRTALNTRYSLLPYLYSLMAGAHILGDAVTRPMFYEFVTDSMTWDIDTQLMIGPSLLFVPAMRENANDVLAYLPNENWYDWYTHECVSKFSLNRTNGEWRTLPAPFIANATLPLLLRGGSIVATQTPGSTVSSTRTSPYTLTVALDEVGDASGWIIVDDGETLVQSNNAYNFTFVACFNLSAFQISGLLNFTGFDHVVNGVDLSNAQVERIVVLGLGDSAANQTMFNATVGSSVGESCMSLNVSQLSLGRELIIDVSNSTVLTLSGNWVLSINDGCVMPPMPPEDSGPGMFILLLVCGGIVIGILGAVTWFRSRGRPSETDVDVLPSSPPRERHRSENKQRRRHRGRESRRELLLDSDDDYA